MSGCSEVAPCGEESSPGTTVTRVMELKYSDLHVFILQAPWTLVVIYVSKQNHFFNRLNR